MNTQVKMISPKRNSGLLVDAAAGYDDFKTPLYHRIYLKLKQDVTQGIYPPNTCLPSEQEISRAFGVSRITAKRAMDELAAEGLVIRGRGRGTRVCFEANQEPITMPIEGSLGSIRALWTKATTRLIDVGYEAAPRIVAQALAIEPHSRVQRVTRIRLRDGQVFSFVQTYIPITIGRPLTKKDFTSKPHFALVERFGIRLGRITQTISAELADAIAAFHLEVGVGSALIQIHRRIEQKDGGPVEFVIALHRPDRYRYLVEFKDR